MINETDILSINITRDSAAKAAIAGLDFIVRNQVNDVTNANCGRFSFIYDCSKEQTTKLTPNWVTGTTIEALLSGYRFTKDEKYLDAAGCGIEYIKSLQTFSKFSKFSYGAINETTPQCQSCHPRDALTAAWAMLDWSQETSDKECFERALVFADWYINNVMPEGYPVCTFDFNDGIVAPFELASCQGGGGFFFYRLYTLTGNEKYLEVLRTIIKYYNDFFLDNNGRPISLIDQYTRKAKLNQQQELGGSLWEMMHVYNDDFAALANLAAYSLEPRTSYLDSLKKFFKFIKNSQNYDGGFGPKTFSVPSAGGACLIEFLAAKALGLDLIDQETIDNTVRYLLDRQCCKINSSGNGGFFGVSVNYEISDIMINMRTTSYAVMGLLRYAGASDPYYFFTKQ
jgi:hypothetical protein